MDDRGRQPFVSRHRLVPSLAQHRHRVRHSGPGGARARSLDRVADRASLPLVHTRRTHRDGAARPGARAVQSARSGRADADPDLFGPRRTRRRNRHGVPSILSVRVRVAVRQECAEETGRGPVGSPDRDKHLQRSRSQVASARSQRHQQGSLVAGAVVRRRDRRASDETVWHPDVRALGQRSRRHQRLRSQAPPQHLDLYLGGETRRARPILFRGRSARLRRPRVRHRRPVQSRSRLDRRRCADEIEGSIRGDELTDPEARGDGEHSGCVFPGFRTTPAPSRRRAEQHHRQSPRGADTGHGDLARRPLQRSGCPANVRSRSDPGGSKSVRPGTRRDSPPTSLFVQQSQLLVSAVDRHGLCDREHPRDGSERLRRDCHGRTRWRTGDAADERRHPTAEDVRLRDVASCTVSRDDCQPVQPDGQHADQRGRIRCVAVSADDTACVGQAARRQRTRGRRVLVLCGAGWRCTLSELHARAGGKRPARRSQPSLLRYPEPGGAGIELRVAKRPGELRKLSGVFHGSRAGASVVGAGDWLEELPRTVDQRGIRAVLRRVVRRKGSGSQLVAEPSPANAADGDRCVTQRTDLSRLSPRPHPG